MRDKKYIVLSVIFFLVALGMFLLPDRENKEELGPEELLMNTLDDSWYVSTDEVAERIINGDPTLQLIDLRNAEQYDNYAIPGALNIPVSEMLNQEWMDMFDLEGMNFIFYSNDDVLASQVWLIYSRIGIENIFIMEGGLNYWVETILEPEVPPISAPSEIIAQYQFRQGASIYFGGGVETSSEVESKTLPLRRKKKKTVTSGGC
jgi:rhodanese-related sulfurtransferase